MKKMIKSLLLMIFGGILIGCKIAGLVDDFWSGMGVALLACGIANLIRQIKYQTNEQYREKVDISVCDERNKYLSMKAWSWSGYWFVLLMGCAGIGLKILNYEEESLMASSGLCLMLVLYWINYLYLSRKY